MVTLHLIPVSIASRWFFSPLLRGFYRMSESLSWFVSPGSRRSDLLHRYCCAESREPLSLLRRDALHLFWYRTRVPGACPSGCSSVPAPSAPQATRGCAGAAAGMQRGLAATPDRHSPYAPETWNHILA